MTVASLAPVSVVITNHNYQRFVGAAIDSALAQGEGVEVVVVDDGSTDASSQILAGYQGRVELLLQDNGGQGSAFNAGFAAARGELIVLLDADDVLLDGAVARIREAAAAEPDAVMFQHPMRVIDGDGRWRGATLPEAGRTLPEGDLRTRLLSGPDDIAWQPASGLAFRAEALRRVLPIPADAFRICADVFLMNTVALYGTVAAIDTPGAGYRDHGANAHLRNRFDLDRLVATIARSDITHAEIRRRAAELDLVASGSSVQLRSVTDHAGRLLVHRLGGGSAAGHDGRVHHVLSGMAAAHRRPDIGRRRKLAMTGWFLVAAFAPRRLLPRLASVALRR